MKDLPAIDDNAFEGILVLDEDGLLEELLATIPEMPHESSQKPAKKTTAPKEAKGDSDDEGLESEEEEGGKKTNADEGSFAGESIRLYLKEIAKIPLFSKSEEYALAQRYWKNKDPEARRMLIEANLRWVVKIAKKYMHFGMPFIDVIEEGNMGLLIAIEKFNPSLGFRISTYSGWWIMQSITRALSQKNRIVRLPVHKVDDFLKMGRVMRSLTKELGESPTNEQVAERMGITPEKVMELKRDTREPMSLDRPIGEGEDGDEFGDMIVDNRPSPEDNVISVKAFPEAEQLLKLLEPQERYIVALRFGMTYALTSEDIEAVLGIIETQTGDIASRIAEKLQPPKEVLYDRAACGDWVEKVKLDDLDPHEIFVFCYRFGRWEGDKATLDEIGRTLCVTRERIRQIERDALLKLRKHVSRAKSQGERHMVIGSA